MHLFSAALLGGSRWAAGFVFMLASLSDGPASSVAQEAAAARYDLGGRVVDARTGEPVEGAVVSAPARGRGVLSRADGTFTLPSVPSGVQIVRIQRLGFEAHETFVDVGEDAAPLVVPLSPKPPPPDGVDMTWERNTDLVGTVFDGGSGRPLPDVTIWHEARDEGATTDSVGAFRFTGAPSGRTRLQIDRAGYARQVVEISLAPDALPVEIVLVPDSSVLTGLPALSDALRGRRNYYGAPVHAIDHAELSRSGLRDAATVVGRLSRTTVVACRGTAGSHSCVQRRGRPVEALVCIDGVPLQHGLDELRRIRPHELYLLEIYGTSGTTIRAYTHAYIESLAREGASPSYALEVPEPGAVTGLGRVEARPPSELAESWGRATC